MDPALAEVLGSFAYALAAMAVFAALLTAIVNASVSRKAEISPVVPYLAALGITLFIFGRLIEYVFAG
jgi:ABC-type uncharacterized transport system permease subunit